MSKILKDPHVYVPCGACGKTHRLKLKWALKHKSLKCSGCKSSVDLRAVPAKGLIARTVEVVDSFLKAMDALHDEAKRDAKLAKARKKAEKKAKKGKKKKAKVTKKAAKKRSSKTSAAKPLLSAPGVSTESGI